MLFVLPRKTPNHNHSNNVRDKVKSIHFFNVVQHTKVVKVVMVKMVIFDFGNAVIAHYIYK